MPSTTATTDMGADRSTLRMASSAARATANERILGGCHVLEIALEDGFPLPVAGQFVMLSTDDPAFPLLPRPFSVLGARQTDQGVRLQFLIMPVGAGSGALCSLPVDGLCQVVGPMGHGFDETLLEGPLVCVAGGYGVAPFLFLAETWRDTQDPRLASLTVIFGARDADRLSLAERLAATGCTVELCTEDGSRGTLGRVDARLETVLGTGHVAGVLTCGPDAMMEAVGVVAHDAGVPCGASLESVMGCGYAVCNGCAVGVGDPSDPDGYTYELACREGTLFDEARLFWNLL
jgi:dihydroorotate dehydrogenase electron transfer subunit